MIRWHYKGIIQLDLQQSVSVDDDNDGIAKQATWARLRFMTYVRCKSFFSAHGSKTLKNDPFFTKGRHIPVIENFNLGMPICLGFPFGCRWATEYAVLYMWAA